MEPSDSAEPRITAREQPPDRWDPEPRWPALVAVLAVGSKAAGFVLLLLPLGLQIVRIMRGGAPQPAGSKEIPIT